ncbi:MAG: hypothetical protein K8I60_16280, partial [Anaerolineae bacterium]|nr:hypothetical protein [Anaerolineae bacterium]
VWQGRILMRILVWIATTFTTLLHTIIPPRFSQPRQDVHAFYPDGYMREEIEALRQDIQSRK